MVRWSWNSVSKNAVLPLTQASSEQDDFLEQANKQNAQRHAGEQSLQLLQNSHKQP